MPKRITKAIMDEHFEPTCTKTLAYLAKPQRNELHSKFRGARPGLGWQFENLALLLNSTALAVLCGHVITQMINAASLLLAQPCLLGYSARYSDKNSA